MSAHAAPERSVTVASVALRVAIVGLALGTAYIHSTLGGLLFTLNAVGYLTLAAAMIVPLPLAVRYRGFVRLALIGYAVTTIVGWAIQGPFYSTAYLAKAIELTLIIVTAIDFMRADGNPVTYVRRELGEIFATVRGRVAGLAGA